MRVRLVSKAIPCVSPHQRLLLDEEAMTKSPQSRYRQRKLDQGYRRCQLWIHESIERQVREHVRQVDRVRRAKEVLRKERRT